MGRDRLGKLVNLIGLFMLDTFEELASLSNLFQQKS